MVPPDTGSPKGRGTSARAIYSNSLARLLPIVDKGQRSRGTSGVESHQRIPTPAGSVLPSKTQLGVEIFYLKTALTSWLFKVNITLGILCLLFTFLLSEKWNCRMGNLCCLLLIASFLVHTATIGIRTYIGGVFLSATDLKPCC